ncbi:type II secretion system protein GspC [Aquisalimonas sp.]|uniref:type II secretion system protein GspC n=1 Tax=Aquisalimonas sp. TaxID=1872621 RepID=UPI0025B845A9|nr:type II secretion system protein GspC [Aquisalimonas sp.]
MTDVPSLLPGLQWNSDYLQRLALPVTVVLVILVAYSAARLTWGLMPPPAEDVAPPAPAPSQAMVTREETASPEAIAQWHLFGEAEPLDSEPPARIDAPETRLNLQLKGVFYSPDAARAQAIVTTGRDGTKQYRAGDSIRGGGTIEAIYEDRVILRREGAFETLSLPGERIPLNRQLADLDLDGGNGSATAVAQPAEPSAEAQGAPEPGAEDALQQYRQQLMDDPRSLAQMINMQPAMEGGEMVGVRISPGQEPQIMDLLGLQPDDVVTAIDGTALSNPNDAFQALQGLSADGPIELRVRRDDTEQTMLIDLH